MTAARRAAERVAIALRAGANEIEELVPVEHRYAPRVFAWKLHNAVLATITAVIEAEAVEL